MKIEPLLPIKGPHGHVRKKAKDSPKKIFRGTLTFYVDALYSTLVEIRPRICLEIGTHRGGTAKTFQRYFDNYCKDGWLLTVDIKKYVNIEKDNIKQCVVYPHVENIRPHHMEVADKDMLSGFEEIENSVEKNCSIIQDELNKAGFDKFDFVFVDGDHQRESFLKDVEISKRLSHAPHYILLDDVCDYVHDSAIVFDEEIKPKYSHYLFENWKDSEEIRSSKRVNDVDTFMAGTALIWEKQ